MIKIASLSFIVLVLASGHWNCSPATSTSAPTPLVVATSTPTATPVTGWTPITTGTFAARGGQGEYLFNNAMWIVGGNDLTSSTNTPLNDVWTSTDGSSWTEITAAANFSARTLFGSLVFNNKLWVIAGLAGATIKQDVWSSTDGLTWAQATATAAFPARYAEEAIVFNNKMWVFGGLDSAGGNFNDVWSSTDGITWTQVTNSANFSPRSGAMPLVFNNKIWIFGGFNYGGGANTFYKDVWSSSDGTNWTQATNNAAFGQLAYAQCLVYNNAMWVMGGSASTTSTSNLCWYSTDGATWTQQTFSTTFTGRDTGSALLFNNSMWIIGGYTGFTSCDNKIWHYP